MDGDGMDFKEALDYVGEMNITIAENTNDSEDESDKDNEDEDYRCKNIWTILLKESTVEGVNTLESLK